MKLIRLAALAVLATLALTACHKGAKNSDQRTASGEVLEGTISDAMIPYESLKSRPPLAPRTASKGSGAAATTSDSAEPDAAAAEAPAEPAPAAAPSPTIRF